MVTVDCFLDIERSLALATQRLIEPVIDKVLEGGDTSPLEGLGLSMDEAGYCNYVKLMAQSAALFGVGRLVDIKPGITLPSVSDLGPQIDLVINQYHGLTQEFLKGSLQDLLGVGDSAITVTKSPSDKSPEKEKLLVGARAIASLATSRMAQLGFLAQARFSGVTYYVVNAVLDKRTCKVCRAMDGKMFPIAQAWDRINELIKIKSADAMKEANPWIGHSKEDIKWIEGASEADLIHRGLQLPPYHLLCRCLCDEVTSHEYEQNSD